jgi:hypothetical protein
MLVDVSWSLRNSVRTAVLDHWSRDAAHASWTVASDQSCMIKSGCESSMWAFDMSTRGCATQVTARAWHHGPRLRLVGRLHARSRMCTDGRWRVPPHEQPSPSGDELASPLDFCEVRPVPSPVHTVARNLCSVWRTFKNGVRCPCTF